MMLELKQVALWFGLVLLTCASPTHQNNELSHSEESESSQASDVGESAETHGKVTQELTSPERFGLANGKSRNAVAGSLPGRSAGVAIDKEDFMFCTEDGQSSGAGSNELSHSDEFSDEGMQADDLAVMQSDEADETNNTSNIAGVFRDDVQTDPRSDHSSLHYLAVRTHSRPTSGSWASQTATSLSSSSEEEDEHDEDESFITDPPDSVTRIPVKPLAVEKGPFPSRAALYPAHIIDGWPGGARGSGASNSKENKYLTQGQNQNHDQKENQNQDKKQNKNQMDILIDWSGEQLIPDSAVQELDHDSVVQELDHATRLKDFSQTPVSGKEQVNKEVLVRPPPLANPGIRRQAPAGPEHKGGVKEENAIVSMKSGPGLAASSSTENDQKEDPLSSESTISGVSSELIPESTLKYGSVSLEITTESPAVDTESFSIVDLLISIEDVSSEADMPNPNTHPQITPQSSRGLAGGAMLAANANIAIDSEESQEVFTLFTVTPAANKPSRNLHAEDSSEEDNTQEKKLIQVTTSRNSIPVATPPRRTTANPWAVLLQATRQHTSTRGVHYTDRTVKRSQSNYSNNHRHSYRYHSNKGRKPTTSDESK